MLNSLRPWKKPLGMLQEASIMKRDLEKRLAVPEAKANPRMIAIATWVDLMRVAELEDEGIE
jgi:hypothetical protein